MATQDELIVRIGADFDELKKGLKKAGDETEKFGGKAEKVSSSFVSSMGKMKTGALAVAAAIAAVTVALKAFQSSVAENAKEQRLWASRLAVNVETFSQLALVGQAFGATVDDMGDSIKDLNERIADAARGNKTYGDALKIIGLNAKDLIKIPIEDQFLKVADAIGKMTNAGDQNFVTAELMADAGFRLLPAFRAGEKGIREMMKAYEDLGSAFNEEEVQLYKDYDKALISLKQAAFAVAKPLANELTSALTGAAEATAKVLRDTISYREELKALRLELEATADSGKVMSSELGEIDVGLAPMTGSFDLLAESAKSSVEVIEEVGKALEVAQGREGFTLPTIRGGLETESDINEMFETALAPDTINQMFEAAMDATEHGEMSLIDIVRRSEAEKLAIVQANEKAKEDARKKWAQDAYNGTKQTLGIMSQLMESENRKMFEVGKAAATANAVVSTLEAAMNAWSSLSKIPYVGYALGAAAAAATVAAGMARVQKIQNTKIGGGASTLSGGGGVPTLNTGGQGQFGQGGPVNQTNVDVTLQGSQFSENQVRELIGQINAQADDNFVVRTA